MRLGIVLHQLQVIFLANRSNIYIISISSIKMHEQDSLGTLRDGSFYPRTIQIQRVRARLHEDRLQPILRYRQDRSDISVGRHDDLITHLHHAHLNISTEDEGQGIQSIPHAYTLARTNVSGIVFLEVFHLIAEQVPSRIDHPSYRLVNLFGMTCRHFL